MPRCDDPPARVPLTLDELIAGITDDNLHDETDWGPSVGRDEGNRSWLRTPPGCSSG